MINLNSEAKNKLRNLFADFCEKNGLDKTSPAAIERFYREVVCNS